MLLQRAAQAAFVAAPAAQVVLDSTGTVVLLNARAQRDLALRERDVGRLFHELDLSHSPLELRGSVAAVQASGQPAELRDVAWTPPGAAPAGGTSASRRSRSTARRRASTSSSRTSPTATSCSCASGTSTAS